MRCIWRSPVNRMIGKAWQTLPALLIVLASGCETLSTTDRGVIGGGLIGAGTGAVVGNAVGDTAAGALVGGAVGAVSGGLVGNAIERSERKQDAKLAAATAPPYNGPLDLPAVVMLTQQGVSEDVIINQIHTTGSVFHLNPNDLVYLQQNRVSDRVIQAMQRTASGPPPRGYPGPHPVAVYPAPVYVMPPPPPPPVRVGFGFGFSNCGRCR
jgi:hypothetical protein